MQHGYDKYIGDKICLGILIYILGNSRSDSNPVPI